MLSGTALIVIGGAAALALNRIRRRATVSSPVTRHGLRDEVRFILQRPVIGQTGGHQ